MKKILIVFILLILSILVTRHEGVLEAKTKNDTKIAALADKYREWLDLVTHISSKEERQAFLLLDNDRDREVFISLFWNLRDPSPGTAANEFMIEHMARFQHANKYFKYGSSRAGWKIDQGKIYIILGPPDSIDRYEMDTTVLPVQIWSYYGKNRPGLPPSFWIVFFKKDGIGEYRLYDPGSDGPYSLLRKRKEMIDMDPLDYEGNFNMIREEHPVLAKASLSLIPDDTNFNYSPSLRSYQLLNQVLKYPQKQINDTYAGNFLKYKGHVEVDYAMNYVEAKHRVAVFRNPETGLNFVNFALRPQSISAVTSGTRDDYTFTFDLTVGLKKGDRSIFEYRKAFPFSGSREELLEKFSNSLTFSDCFPVIEGEYDLAVLLQNRVNKEFTFFDQKITVKPTPPALPRVAPLLVTGEIKWIDRRALLPFKLRDMEITPDPGRVFGREDKIFAVFGIDRGTYEKELTAVVQVRHLADPDRYQKDYTAAVSRDKEMQFFNEELGPLPPGYYRVQVRLTTPSGALLSEKSREITVSNKKTVAQTSNIFRISSLDNIFVYYHILGLQYRNLGRLDKAEPLIARAFNMRPNHPPFIKDYAALLLKTGQNDRALEVVEKLKTNEKQHFDYHGLRGKIFYRQGRYKKAVAALRKANDLYDSDTSVLNVLGLSYLKSGNRTEAQKVFSSSLKINPKQPQISRLLKEITTPTPPK